MALFPTCNNLPDIYGIGPIGSRSYHIGTCLVHLPAPEPSPRVPRVPRVPSVGTQKCPHGCSGTDPEEFFRDQKDHSDNLVRSWEGMMTLCIGIKSRLGSRGYFSKKKRHRETLVNHQNVSSLDSTCIEAV